MPCFLRRLCNELLPNVVSMVQEKSHGARSTSWTTQNFPSHFCSMSKVFFLFGRTTGWPSCTNTVVYALSAVVETSNTCFRDVTSRPYAEDISSRASVGYNFSARGNRITERMSAFRVNNSDHGSRVRRCTNTVGLKRSSSYRLYRA